MEAKSQSAGSGGALPQENFNPNGSTVVARYLHRHQEYVSVNRNDLEDLLSYDTDALAFGSIGMFFVSGAAWILAEQWLGPDGFQMSPLVAVCIALLPVGSFLIWQGKRQHDKKRGKIHRIFAETEEIDGPHKANVSATTTGLQSLQQRSSTQVGTPR